jgi:micrococcal nuclease
MSMNSAVRLAFVLLLATAPAHSAQGQTKTLELVAGRVISVADGDTVVMVVAGRERRVRLDAIDAPELAQTYGTRARAALERLCDQRDATLRVEKTDRVGRSVGQLTCAGRDVNEAMIRGGHAWVFTRFVERSSPLYGLQDEARKAQRGLWAEKNPVPPWQWRDQARDEQPWLAKLYDAWQRWRSQ